VSNAATQHISVAVGLQERFNWRNVAASAVSAGIGQALQNAQLGLSDTATVSEVGGALKAWEGTASAGVKMAVNLGQGLTRGVTGALVRGGRIDSANIAADAFGNVLGQALGEAISAPEPSVYGAGGRAPRGFRFAPGLDLQAEDRFSISGDFSVTRAGAGARLDARGDFIDEDFRSSERALRMRTERSVAGSSTTARAGDSISRLVGSSDPQAIGNFMRANNLRSDRIEAGRSYFVPESSTAYGESAALGKYGLALSNERAAMRAEVQREAARFASQAEQASRAPVWSFREASAAQRLADDAAAQALATNGRYMSAWDGRSGDPQATVSPAYKAVTAGLGMVTDGLGVVQGAAITFTGAALTAAPEPTTLTKWAGVPLTAYGAAFTAKSAAGFGLNATNLIIALRGSTAEREYLPGSALELAVRLGGGSPEAQRFAVAGDMAWGLATGRVLDARIATGAVTNPRIAALFQAPAWTSAELQAKVLAPNAWNMVTRVEPRAGLLDLTVKSYENIWQPLVPPKKE
jgi:hypothetical protein